MRPHHDDNDQLEHQHMGLAQAAGLSPVLAVHRCHDGSGPETHEEAHAATPVCQSCPPRSHSPWYKPELASLVVSVRPPGRNKVARLLRARVGAAARDPCQLPQPAPLPFPHLPRLPGVPEAADVHDRQAEVPRQADAEGGALAAFVVAHLRQAHVRDRDAEDRDREQELENVNEEVEHWVMVCCRARRDSPTVYMRSSLRSLLSCMVRTWMIQFATPERQLQHSDSISDDMVLGCVGSASIGLVPAHER